MIRLTSWPSPTASRHMNTVHDEQPTVVIAIGRNPYTLTSICDLGRCFHAHNCVALIVDLDKSIRLLLIQIDE